MKLAQKILSTFAPRLLSEGLDFEQDVYLPYSRMVRQLLYNLAPDDDLDDLVQEVFIKIYKNISKFRGDSSIKTWIYRIAINTLKDHWRKKDHSHEELKDYPEETNSRYEDADLIQRALSKLDNDKRVVLVMYYFEEFSQEEISKMLKVPLGTVKSRLHNAKSEMKLNVSKMGGLNEF